MTHSDTERRRLRRLALPEDASVELKMSIPVQILDLSRAGVMLGSSTELTVGDRAELHATIGPESFSVSVEIRHVAVETQPRGRIRYRAGAILAPMTAEQQVLLDRIIGLGLR